MVYLLKLNFALMLLYGFYRVMMSSDTFFGYRRLALWGILATSIFVPLLSIQPMIEHNPTAVGMATVYADYVLPVVPVYAEAPHFSWVDALVTAYWVGVAAFGLRFLLQLSSILWRVARTPVVEVDGGQVHQLSGESSPFSFFHWIFVCPEAYSDEQLHEIMIHERTHVQQFHSLDIIVSELFCVFNWFNPFCYLTKREIRLNLEYLADEAVIDEGSARKTYQYHLLGLAYHPARRDLTNNFNVLPLKNRIKMMNKRRTNEVRKVKYLLFIPLAAGLLAVSNIEMIARTIAQSVPAAANLADKTERLLAQQATVVETPGVVQQAGEMGLSDESIDQKGKKVYSVVERMPSFPGGMKALMEYLATNIKYPKECSDKGIEGRVIVSFIVEKDGSISGAKVVRSIDPMLDAEALRVINSMPKWTPGMQSGKPVAVKYNIPISFKKTGGPLIPAGKASSNSDFISEFYPGGTVALMTYLAERMKYPAAAQKVGAEGTYYVILKVKPDGSHKVQDVARSENSGQNIQGQVNVVGYSSKGEQTTPAESAEGYAALAKEARSIAEQLPQFKAPGKETTVTIPLSFKLQ